MTHSKQSAKRARQSNRRRDQNKATRTTLRGAMKKVTTATGKAEAQAVLSEAFSKVDKAAKLGVIHKNAAARHKSRLVKAIAAKP